MPATERDVSSFLFKLIRSRPKHTLLQNLSISPTWDHYRRI